MSRLRYCKNAIEEIKASDPNTAVTEKALRKWINAGVLPYLKVGSRTMVDVDCILSLLEMPREQDL